VRAATDAPAAPGAPRPRHLKIRKEGNTDVKKVGGRRLIERGRIVGGMNAPHPRAPRAHVSSEARESCPLLALSQPARSDALLITESLLFVLWPDGSWTHRFGCGFTGAVVFSPGPAALRGSTRSRTIPWVALFLSPSACSHDASFGIWPAWRASRVDPQAISERRQPTAYGVPARRANSSPRS